MKTETESHSHQYVVVGVIALIVGIVLLPAVCGGVAAYQGRRAQETGASTAGPIVLCLGVLELIIGGLFWLSLLA